MEPQVKINPDQDDAKVKEDIFSLVTLGNKDAIEVLRKISFTVRIWDDLYDKDKEVDSNESNSVISFLAFDLGTNEFYRKHRDRIESVIFVGWNAWMDSNQWHNSKDKLQSSAAFFLRDSINEVVFLIAWLCGGTAHARKISSVIRHFYLMGLVKNDAIPRSERN